MSRKKYRFVRDTRSRLPTRRPSNADKTLRSPTQLATARGTTKPDSERHVVVSVEAANSAAHGDVDHTPMKSWSDRGLQVLDLKAAVAPLCSGMIVVACSSSPAAPVDGNHTYHKVPETRSQTSSTHALSTSRPT